MCKYNEKSTLWEDRACQSSSEADFRKPSEQTGGNNRKEYWSVFVVALGLSYLSFWADPAALELRLDFFCQSAKAPGTAALSVTGFVHSLWASRLVLCTMEHLHRRNKPDPPVPYQSRSKVALTGLYTKNNKDTVTQIIVKWRQTLSCLFKCTQRKRWVVTVSGVDSLFQESLQGCCLVHKLNLAVYTETTLKLGKPFSLSS